MLAEKGRGRVSPNPLVGAVLVRRGRIIARGWHRRFGGPHAEVECLDAARGDLRQATLYVNLEPCAHYGKTPPCVDRIITSGVREVVIATKDPNPVVAGCGIRKLRGTGVCVVTGVLEKEAAWLNRFFLKHIATGVPYLHMKIAQTIDGYIGGQGAPRPLTSPASLRLVHLWRSEYDAVLIGAGTVAADDPQITVRHVRGRQPHVIILDGKLSLKDSHTLLRVSHDRYVFLCVAKEYVARQRARVRTLEDRGIIVLRFAGSKGDIRLSDVLGEVYKYGVGSILIEGGSAVFTRLRDEGLADEVSVFVAPFFLGGGTPVYATPGVGSTQRRSIASTVIRTVGRDVLFHTTYSHGG